MAILPKLLLILCLFGIPPFVRPQLPPAAAAVARDLDALVQDYAYRAFLQPRTGVIYDVTPTLPANLTGVKVSAMRLRTGSFRIRGVPSYKEFQIPVGVIEQPYVERLVLVYTNLGNWSEFYYPLPAGYIYLTPLLGLVAYDARDLSAKNLPELDIRPTHHPILIRFPGLKSSGLLPTPRCVYFDLRGSINFSNVLPPGNICSTIQQGHFSIVVEEGITPSPSPSPDLQLQLQPTAPMQAQQLPLPTGGGGGGGKGERKRSSNSKMWVIGGWVLGGGLGILVVLGVVGMWVDKYKGRRKMQQMEKAADVGEPLHMTSVGTTKAPAAALTRTLPTLETEYVP